VTDEELTAAIREVQQRARARAPQGGFGLDGVEAADLMPLVHARDAAQAKVAAIGSVNPRPPGLMNSAVQTAKRAAARALDWHVREQVEFNRAAMACVEASIAAMSGVSRSVAALTSHVASDRASQQAAVAAAEAQQRELHSHIQELHVMGGRQAAALEEFRAQQSALLEGLRQEHGAQVEALRYEYGAQVEALRNDTGTRQEQLRLDQAAQFEDWRTRQTAVLEEMQGRLSAATTSHRLLEEAYQRHAARQEEVFRELAQSQHQDFKRALEQNTVDVQKRLWDDLAKVREEFEGLIHRELRLLRQRESLPAPVSGLPLTAAASESQAAIGIDWLHFADRFRGSEERIREQQQRYVQQFAGTTGEILDIGCGRGEFLAALAGAGLSGLGIDANRECVELCLSKGLRAEFADLFAYLEAQADGSLAGVYCAQVIEHLAPAQVAHLVRLLGTKMRSGAWVAVETPNPECLAIFATYFYADPTHTRPVPAALLRFYLEEAGFGSIAVEHMNPAADVIPAIGTLPAPVRDALFGALDYAIFARKL